MHKNIWHSSAFFTLLYGKVFLFSSLQRYINNIYVFKLTISVFRPGRFFLLLSTYCPQIVLLFTPFTATLLCLLYYFFNKFGFLLSHLYGIINKNCELTGKEDSF